MGSGASNSQKANAYEASYALKSKDEKTRMMALEYIFDTADKSESSRPYLGRASLDLLPELKNILRHRSGMERDEAVDCLVLLSSSEENLATMGSSQLGLMPYVIANIPNCVGCTSIAANVAFLPDNHAYLLSEEVGLMKFIMNKFKEFEITDISDDSDFIWILTNLTESLKSENVDLFLSYDPLQAVVKRLLNTPAEDLCSGFDFWILSFLESISCHPAAASKLKELNAVPCLMQLMTNPGIAGVKASLTLFNILGKEEETEGNPTIVQSHPQMITRVLKLLRAVLAPSSVEEAQECKKVIPDYVFGTVTVRSLCSALCSLSISDTNKPLLVKMDVLELLVCTLRLFTSNAPTLSTGSQKAGGGGEDVNTAELVIESLLQLSFCFHSDAALVEAYTWACEHCISDILTVCCKTSESDGSSKSTNKLSPDARSSARCLLSRLLPEDTTASAKIVALGSAKSSTKSTLDAASAKTQHTVLSYSHRDSQLPLVLSVASKLRELGHDIWQASPEGTTLAAANAAADNEITNHHEMTMEAIDSAHTVIVFVSPQYKASALCRVAAKSIQRRQLVNSSLKVLYVMTSANYHMTSASPVDGWLAALVGDSQWYPLWNELMVNSTAYCVHEFLCSALMVDSFKLHGSDASVTSASTASLSYVSPHLSRTSSVDAELAWKLLFDPESEAEPNSLTSYVKSLGLTHKEELLLLSPEEINKISDMMRPLKQRRFLAALNG